jgi:hypothetical protein
MAAAPRGRRRETWHMFCNVKDRRARALEPVQSISSSRRRTRIAAVAETQLVSIVSLSNN